MFTDKFNSLQIKLTHVEHSNTEAAQMLSLLVQKNIAIDKSPLYYRNKLIFNY